MKQILEILQLTILGMTPAILLFTVCYLIKWRHGRKKGDSPQIVTITKGKPERV